LPTRRTRIAEIRPAPFRLQVVTRYRARTSVERWQLQDRLRVRLRELGVRAGPRFSETADGRLAFTLWTGFRGQAVLAGSLAGIDLDDPSAGSRSNGC
jgi:hypothetical protein